MTWAPAPPEVTWLFFSASPPKATMSRVLLDDGHPVSDATRHRLEGADDMRQKKLRRAKTIIAQLVDAAAAEEQKAPRQRTRVVDAAGG